MSNLQKLIPLYSHYQLTADGYHNFDFEFPTRPKTAYMMTGRNHDRQFCQVSFWFKDKSGEYQHFNSQVTDHGLNASIFAKVTSEGFRVRIYGRDTDTLSASLGVL